MRFVQVLALIGAVLTLIGCSSASNPGTPTPEPRPTYPEFLPDHARKDLNYLESLRPLDVCGFLDRQALAALGPTSYIGADGEYESCTARFPNGKARHGISKVEVSIGTIGGTGWGTKIAVGNATIAYNNAGGDFCTANTNFDDRQQISFMVFAALLSEPIDLCAEAIDVATASLPLLKTRPLRADSDAKYVNTKLARLDSCAAMPAFIDADQAIKVSVSKRVPWGCGWMADYYEPNSRVDVSFLRAGDAHIGKVSDTDTDIALDIGGFPANAKPGTSRYPDYCQLWIGVEAVRPDLQKRRREIDLSDYPIELIRLTTDSGGCDRAAQIGTELVRLYKLLP